MRRIDRYIIILRWLRWNKLGLVFCLFFGLLFIGEEIGVYIDPANTPIELVESAEDAESEKEGEEKEKEGEEKIGSDFSQIMLLSSLKYGVQYSHLDEGSSVPRELETPPPELKA